MALITYDYKMKIHCANNKRLGKGFTRKNCLTCKHNVDIKLIRTNKNYTQFVYGSPFYLFVPCYKEK